MLMTRRIPEVLFCLILLLALQLFTPGLWADSLWKGAGSDFSDNVALKEGDIVMIEVSESTEAQADSDREREKNVEIGGESGTGSGQSTIIHDLAELIPIFGATISGNSEYDSERELDASESLNTRISVMVDEVQPNGVMKLKGERKIKYDDEIKNITFVGYARTHDVRSDNTIPSDRIANARIFYEGELGLRDGEPRTIVGKTWKFFKNVLFW